MICLGNNILHTILWFKHTFGEYGTLCIFYSEYILFERDAMKKLLDSLEDQHNIY